MVDRMLRALRRAQEPVPVAEEERRIALPIALPNGETVDALDITDGCARLIITRVPYVDVDGEERYGTSVDTANLSPEYTLRLYRDAEVIVRDIDDRMRAARIEEGGDGE